MFHLRKQGIGNECGKVVVPVQWSEEFHKGDVQRFIKKEENVGDIVKANEFCNTLSVWDQKAPFLWKWCYFPRTCSPPPWYFSLPSSLHPDHPCSWSSSSTFQWENLPTNTYHLSSPWLPCVPRTTPTWSPPSHISSNLPVHATCGPEKVSRTCHFRTPFSLAWDHTLFDSSTTPNHAFLHLIFQYADTFSCLKDFFLSCIPYWNSCPGIWVLTREHSSCTILQKINFGWMSGHGLSYSGPF